MIYVTRILLINTAILRKAIIEHCRQDENFSILIVDEKGLLFPVPSDLIDVNVYHSAALLILFSRIQS